MILDTEWLLNARSLTSKNALSECLVQVHGTTESRITIRAQGGEANKDDVILHGAGESTRVFELNHDFYTLEVSHHKSSANVNKRR